MVLTGLHSEKGGANTLRVPLILKKYKTMNYDACRMRRYSWNILQWNKNDMKSMKMTTRVYYKGAGSEKSG